MSVIPISNYKHSNKNIPTRFHHYLATFRIIRIPLQSRSITIKFNISNTFKTTTEKCQEYNE